MIGSNITDSEETVFKHQVITKITAQDTTNIKQTSESCNCLNKKMPSCQNCVPINIKVLGNVPDVRKSAHEFENSLKTTEQKSKNYMIPSKNMYDLPDLSDIDGLLDFIQGNKPIDKIAMAKKKAAKKARQKLKKVSINNFYFHIY